VISKQQHPIFRFEKQKQKKCEVNQNSKKKIKNEKNERKLFVVFYQNHRTGGFFCQLFLFYDFSLPRCVPRIVRCCFGSGGFISCVFSSFFFFHFFSFHIEQKKEEVKKEITKREEGSRVENRNEKETPKRCFDRFLYFYFLASI